MAKKAVRIVNLDKHTHTLFRRALQLAGAGSQARWLATQIRRFIREQQSQFGEDLFQVLTAEESDILAVIESGAAEIQQIAMESLLPISRVQAILDDLIDREIIDVRKKGGKTEGARGAVVKLYFVSPKYRRELD